MRNDPPYSVEQIDHIVLRVRDLDRSVAFYATLGGIPQRRAEQDFAMIGIGADQRIVLVSEPDYVPGAMGNVEHFNLRITNAQNIGQVVDYLASHGIPMHDEPRDEGRGFTQFRVLDPDGNQVEMRLRNSLRGAS